MLSLQMPWQHLDVVKLACKGLKIIIQQQQQQQQHVQMTSTQDPKNDKDGNWPSFQQTGIWQFKFIHHLFSGLLTLLEARSETGLQGGIWVNTAFRRVEWISKLGK